MSRSTTRSTQRLVKPGDESSSDEHLNQLELYYPVCVKFVPNSQDENICGCNRPYKHHEKIEKNQQIRIRKLNELKAIEWFKQKCTTPVGEKAHGRLKNGAKYARIDIETEPDIVQQIFHGWKLPEPKMIMSIIGGSKSFTLTDRLETNLINGIVNVAITSHIWIITNGYNNGLVQLAEQAFYKAKLRKPKQEIVTMAICKWGAVKNPENLIQQKKKLDASHNSENEDEMEARQKDEYALNMNHSHYLMLDDARYGHADTEDYRTRLCSYIAKSNHKNGLPIPVITIVVDGGDATISNIYYDLKENIPVVIIDGSGRVADFFSRWLLYTKHFDKDEQKDIVYGIDELKSIDDANTNRTQQNSSKPNKKVDENHSVHSVRRHEIHTDLHVKKLYDLFSDHKEKLESDLRKLLYDDDDYYLNMTKHRTANAAERNLLNKLETAQEQVMYCLQPSVRSNIIVFNLKSDNDLSETIFRSISQSYKKLLDRKEKEQNGASNKDSSDSKKKGQLEEERILLDLAMDWDCIDVAQEFVIENSRKNIPDEGLYFKRALKDNLHTFVYEFIKLGVQPAEIFFPRNTFNKGGNRYDEFIQELYTEDIMKDPENHLKSTIEANSAFPESEKMIQRSGDLNVILRTLVGDYMYKLYFDSLEEERTYRAKNGLTSKSSEAVSDKSTDRENIKQLTIERNLTADDYIMRDLFIWSILMNRIEMAKVFLSYMKYRICPALIATKILKEYYEIAPYGDLKDSYLESKKYFEQYAIDCLDKCNENNGDTACEIVSQRNDLYGYVTCLLVAANADDELFIARPACVQVMYNVWYDKLSPEQTRIQDRLALLIGFISLGLAAPLFVTYREIKQDEEKQGETLKRTLRSCGIDYCDSYPLEHPVYTDSHPNINRYMHRVINFHRSLMAKFAYHFITYCFFLLLFSYVLLFNFNPPTDQIPSINWTEILTILLVTSMFIEEVHYFLRQDNLTLRGKFFSYFRDIFKLMTVLGFILFYIGLIVRFTYADSEYEFTAARVIMAFDIEIWWLRCLSFIIIIPYLGPHLVAITQMLRDLMFFICIILIVMIAYGVASRSMVYYPIVNNFTTITGGFIDIDFNGREVFYQILYPVYYFLHGYIDPELANLETNPNAGWSIATQVLLAFHMLFVNVLLTNLLIAIFNKRFDEVYERTKVIWHTQQRLFTREYYTRSPFLPPISLICDIYYLCRMLFFFLRRKFFDKAKDRNVRVFKIIPKDKSRIKEWCEFEGASTYEYAHNQVKISKAALTRSSSGQDSRNADKKEETIDNQKDSNNVLDNLKRVQEDVTKLNDAIEEMKGELNNYHGPNDTHA